MQHILIVGANSFIAKHIRSSAGFRTESKFYTAGRSAEFDFQIDLTDEKSIERLNFNEFQFDAVIFCQGLNPSKNLKESDFNHFIQMYAVNVAGPAQLLKQLIRVLKPGASVLFFGSIATKKGSYDPAYASAKAAIIGLTASLVRAYPDYRFNILTLGLVEGSPVFEGMTEDFIGRHANNMFNNQLIKVENVIGLLDELIHNSNINNANFHLDGGYQV